MVLLQMLFTYAPFMNRIFGSAPMSAGLWLDVLGVSVAIFLLVDLDKWIRRRRSSSEP